MKMTEDSPHNISDIFKGVPNNINAAFTWAKDNQTYFFKGPFYYKYNDKAKKVENGYQKDQMFVGKICHLLLTQYFHYHLIWKAV